MSSPSERYAQFDAERRRSRTPLGSFQERYPFALDPFQIRGCEALQEGESVLVAAPTGAGKTVVGEFAVHLALETGRKVFYTAPIKALSNQKHEELSAWLGHERVGLLTGDTSVRPDADVVVMTTEVLRNMLYAGSSLLDGLGFVVMDEVHYLADRLRGPVWEEVIIHLDESVRLVALSATVSNAEEFGAWIDEVRGTVRVIVSETRPVPLWQHVIAGEELLDLFVDDSGSPVVSHGPGAARERTVNPALAQTGSTSTSRIRDEDAGRGGRGGRGRPGGRGRGRGHGTQGRHRLRGSRSGPPDHRGGSDPRSEPGERGTGRGLRLGSRPMRRPDVVALLDQHALLPGIFFIFSRAGCDAAVRQCAQAHLTLTTPEEQRRIRAVLAERLAVIGHEDEQILDLPAFRRAAINGVASHHAGMLPLLKVVVEELFSQGLIKAVFATETLALGINMPARSVVLEKLVKFNGTEHADLTPGEYTQLTGRAGRRGIDTEGHAVVVAGPRFDADAVASLASRRTYPLRSAFRPTPNMAVNLLDRFDLQRARETLEMSFAQFQADRSVVGLARKARETEDTVRSYREALHCERGDVLEYVQLTEQIAAREKALAQQRSAADRDRTRSTLRSLRRGDVVAMPGGKRNGYGVVLDVDRQVLEGIRVEVLTPDARVRTVHPGDLPSAPAVIDALKLPRPERLGSAKVRRDTASALRQLLSGHDPDPRREVRSRAPRAPSTAAQDDALLRLREQLREHPCHDCPEIEAHLRWAGRWRKASAQLERDERRIQGRTSSLARQFDHLVDLLLELGYLEMIDDPEPAGAADRQASPVPTPRGLRLRHLFSDRDLLIAECLDQGAWADLDAAELAAIVSAAVHDSRRDDAGSPELPASSRFAHVLARTEAIGDRLRAAQSRHDVDLTSPPDAGASAIVHRWAQGRHFAAAIGDSGMTAGDFVRHCRQVVDMLEQLAAVDGVAATARESVRAVRRGLVAQEFDR